MAFGNNLVAWLVFAQATRTTKCCHRRGTLAGNWRGATRSEAVRRLGACRLRSTGAVRWDTYRTNTERTITDSTPPRHRRRVSSVPNFREIDNSSCAPARMRFFYNTRCPYASDRFCFRAEKSPGIFSRLFGSHRRSNSKSRKSLSNGNNCCATQFPPDEWFNKSVQPQQSTSTQTEKVTTRVHCRLGTFIFVGYDIEDYTDFGVILLYSINYSHNDVSIQLRTRKTIGDRVEFFKTSFAFKLFYTLDLS